MENLHARDSLGGLELMASESKTTTTTTTKKTFGNQSQEPQRSDRMENVVLVVIKLSPLMRVRRRF